jgi:uncharacterized protein (TIGR00297 family)
MTTETGFAFLAGFRCTWQKRNRASLSGHSMACRNCPLGAKVVLFNLLGFPSKLGQRRAPNGPRRQSAQKISSLRLDMCWAAVPGRTAMALFVNGAFLVAGAVSRQNALTRAGLAHATVLGILLWSSLGWAGWTTCALFLILSSLATRLKLAEKERLNIAEKRGGARGPENVWGAAAVSALCALLHAVLLHLGASERLLGLARLAFVASMATKLGDTLATEIGKAYGRRTFLITTLQEVPAGTEGAVSREGTLACAIGACLLTTFGAISGLIAFRVSVIAICATSAFLATLVESVIGATLQRRYPWLSNEAVNVLNTAVGSALAVTAGAVWL